MLCGSYAAPVCRRCFSLSVSWLLITLGGLLSDNVINCAMCTVLAPFEAFSKDEYRRVTEVTHLGSVNETREAL